jgi:transposase
MPGAEEYQALLAERDTLRDELRLVTAQRDRAEEKLRAYKHELSGASSAARHADQVGLFNEAGALTTTVDTAAREDVPATSVAAHTRGKRGRKSLDSNVAREVVWRELPESEMGSQVRVYVPYGHEWYGYSTRRIKENPRIAGYVLRAPLSGG